MIFNFQNDFQPKEIQLNWKISIFPLNLRKFDSKIATYVYSGSGGGCKLKR